MQSTKWIKYIRSLNEQLPSLLAKTLSINFNHTKTYSNTNYYCIGLLELVLPRPGTHRHCTNQVDALITSTYTIDY